MSGNVIFLSSHLATGVRPLLDNPPPPPQFSHKNKIWSKSPFGIREGRDVSVYIIRVPNIFAYSVWIDKVSDMEHCYKNPQGLRAGRALALHPTWVGSLPPLRILSKPTSSDL